MKEFTLEPEEIVIFDPKNFDFKANAKETKELINQVTTEYNNGDITYEEMLEKLGIYNH